jgi:D-glycero-D-manno-heptose 1,7-bisphosphate phosphatase
MKPAVFLDRDGTIIEETHYISSPEQVRLLPGAARAIRELREAGFACVVISNQSSVGRGMIRAADVMAVQEEVDRQLAAAGAALDGFYWCPVAPQGADREVVEHPDRKPGPGLLLRAAEELELDLSRSWMIGDLVSDLLAGWNAGVQRTILVRTGHGAQVDPSHPAVDMVAEDLREAAELVLKSTDNCCSKKEAR